MKINKCYIKYKRQYKEISYQEYCSLRKNDPNFQSKHFVRFGDALLEVTQEEYEQFNQMQNRYRYTQCLKSLYEKIDNIDKISGMDETEDVFDVVQKRMMYQKLYQAMKHLSAKERKLIYQLYFLKSNRKNDCQERRRIAGNDSLPQEKNISKIKSNTRKLKKTGIEKRSIPIFLLNEFLWIIFTHYFSDYMHIVVFRWPYRCVRGI